MYDSAHRTGFLFNALEYSAKKKRKATKALEDVVDDEEAIADEKKGDVLKLFKRGVLQRERKEVEKKMKETKSFRRNMILNDFQKYQECWQFYFIAADLVNCFHFFLWKRIYNLFCFISFPV